MAVGISFAVAVLSSFGGNQEPSNYNITTKTNTASAATSSPELYVTRHAGFSDPTIAAEVTTIDNQTVTKYPMLQTAMKYADSQYEVFIENCSHGCSAYSVQPWDKPLPTFHISGDIANAILNEPSFGFKIDHGIYLAHIKFNDGLYVISVTFP
jgi:hypothetical protein